MCYFIFSSSSYSVVVVFVRYVSNASKHRNRPNAERPKIHSMRHIYMKRKICNSTVCNQCVFVVHWKEIKKMQQQQPHTIIVITIQRRTYANVSACVYYEIYTKCIKLHVLLLFYRGIYFWTKGEKKKYVIYTHMAEMPKTKTKIQQQRHWKIVIIIYITAILLLGKRIAPS